MESLAGINTRMLPQTAGAYGSMRELWGRHRFKPADRNRPITLRGLAGRHGSRPGTICCSMLWYNAYLIEIEIDVIGAIMDLIPGPSDIPLLGRIWEGVGVGKVSEKMVRTAFQKAMGTNGKLYIGVKPEADWGSDEINKRAAELGRMIAVGQAGDLVVLCEVWTEKTLNKILAPIKRAGKTVRVVMGPGPGAVAPGGSGLCVLSLGPKIRKLDEHIFRNRGRACKDTDAWAGKSVMLTEVDLGKGKLDLYNTHLNWGGDIPQLEIREPDLGIDIVINRDIPGEQFRTRMKQCDEIVDFVKATHNPNHIAVLVGDFNVDGSDSSEYTQLRRRIDKMNLVDQWKWHYGGTAPGMTSGSFDKICKVESLRPLSCDETQSLPASEGGSRYDYVFVEEPTGRHGFNLDIALLQRRPYKRPVAKDNMAYLSDHLALHTELICNS